MKEKRYLLAIYAIVESSVIVSKRRVKNEYKLKFGEDNDYVQQFFIRIFIENNVLQRLKFFCDPLVQFLWTKFRTEGAEIFNSLFKES